MTKYKVFSPEPNNKISFTKAELEALLNEVYNEGYNDGKTSNWTINYGWNSTPRSTDLTATDGTITINNTNASTHAGSIALNKNAIDTTIAYGDKK